MPGNQLDNDEFRIDFQQLLKDLELENVHVTLRDISQEDITDLFKKKNSLPQKKNIQ